MTGQDGMFTVRFGPTCFTVTGAPFAVADATSLLRSFLVAVPGDFSVVASAGNAARASWRFSRVHEVHVCQDGGVVQMRLTEWQAAIDLLRRTAHVRLLGPWTEALDSFFKTLVQLVLLHDGTGVMFHGASVVQNGAGYLFVGPSGAGKTTVADLSETIGAVILSEEIACVSGFRDAGGLVLESVPLRHRRHREVRPCRVPLVGAFELCQATDDEVVRLARGEALGALMRSVTTGVRHEHFLRRAFDMMDQMIRQTPVATLRFRKDTTFWSAIADCPALVRDSLNSSPAEGTGSCAGMTTREDEDATD